MQYRQIVAGPFYGLFAVHLDEYLGWENQQEVVDKLDELEETENIVGAKKIIVFDGMARVEDGEKEKSEEEILSLMDLIKTRGWFILINCAGTHYPVHAKQANHVSAYIKSETGKWLNFPANSLVWVHEGDSIVEPMVSPINANAPKYLYARSEIDNPIALSFKTRFAWQFMRPTALRITL